MGTAGEPVTVVITRTVREGSEEAFEAAVRAWISRALAFPGHLGVHMLRPPHGGREYGAVLTFRSAKMLQYALHRCQKTNRFGWQPARPATQTCGGRFA